MQQCLVPQSAASNPSTPRCNKEENKSDLSSDINTTCLFTTADVSSVGRRLTRELPAALCFTIRCREARANERLRSRSHKKLCADAKHICCYNNPQRLLLNRLWARKTNRARADGGTRPILEKLVPESCFRFLYKNKLLVQKVHFYTAADHLCVMSEAQQKVLHFVFTCSSGYSVVTGKSKTGTQY